MGAPNCTCALAVQGSAQTPQLPRPPPQIFSLDFSSTSPDLPLAGGAVQAPERFSRLCWGPAGAPLDAKLYPVSARLGAAITHFFHAGEAAAGR